MPSTIRFDDQERLAMDLFSAPSAAAIGAAVAYLVHASSAHPDALRRALQAQVKFGQVGPARQAYRIIDVLKEAAK